MKKIIIPLIFISLFIIIPLVNAITVDSALGTSMSDERVPYPESSTINVMDLIIFFLIIISLISIIYSIIFLITTKLKIKKLTMNNNQIQSEKEISPESKLEYEKYKKLTKHYKRILFVGLIVFIVAVAYVVFIINNPCCNSLNSVIY
ncbi:MAG: hypothetical protein ACNFW9_02490 [Candidatus Kerfeldbacteria bacterium]